MRIGTINFKNSSILKMEFQVFEKHWKKNYEKRTGKSAKVAAKKLGIKVPAKTEGGE